MSDPSTRTGIFGMGVALLAVVCCLGGPLILAGLALWGAALLNVLPYAAAVAILIALFIIFAVRRRAR